LAESVFARYRDLQRYVGWAASDEARVVGVRQQVAPHFVELIEDFYAEIERHPAARRTITGGSAQIERLKQTLRTWLAELFTGPYDATYVDRRWRVGLRHVEIGLPQIYTAAALARLRSGLIHLLCAHWTGQQELLAKTVESLNRLLDLDLAIIGDAYETEFLRRQREAERLQVEDALHREKELAAGLLTHAQAAVVVLDRAGRMVRWNPFLETLASGLVEGGVQDRDWFELFLDPSDHDRMRQALLHAEASEKPVPVNVSSLLQQGERKRHLHWSGVPLHDARGLPFAVLVIGQDVTDLYEAQERMVRAERLAAIGQMATGVAHESRNALQRIGATAEMLELELEGNRAALELVARIQQSQQHLHQLLDEVRNYAAPIVLDCSKWRIAEIWREAWELLLAQRRGRQVELREHLVAHDLTIVADRFRLVQVFRNLLDNALAASDEPVCIDVTCEAAQINGADALRIRVRNNGAGMTAEQRRRIFEPFFTTKPTGTGLGTAIAQRLVEAHGGTLEVAGHVQDGTELVLTIPCHASATSSSTTQA